MKKYFLIIALLIVVFLWLGNSYASATCDDINTTYASSLRSADGVDHKFTCETNSTTNTVCPDKTQFCPWTGTSCNGAWMACCICNQPLTPMPSLPAGQIPTTPPWLVASCAGRANSHENSFGGCDCNTWYKNVNDVCQPCNKKWVCCGIQLNTSVPFIGKCIEDTTGNVGPDETGVTWNNAFPVLMSSLTQILVTIILILSFVLIVIGGIMIATGNPSWGKKLIIKVVIGIALLGASGVILRLINPNFFW